MLSTLILDSCFQARVWINLITSKQKFKVMKSYVLKPHNECGLPLLLVRNRNLLVSTKCADETSWMFPCTKHLLSLKLCRPTMPHKYLRYITLYKKIELLQKLVNYHTPTINYHYKCIKMFYRKLKYFNNVSFLEI